MHSLNGRKQCSFSATNERRPSLTQYPTYSTSLPQDALDFLWNEWRIVCLLYDFYDYSVFYSV